MATAANIEFQTAIPKETRQFTWRIADFFAVKKSGLMNAVSMSFRMGDDIGFPVTFRTVLRRFEDPICKWIMLGLILEEYPENAKEVLIAADYDLKAYPVKFTAGGGIRDMNVNREWRWILLPEDNSPSLPTLRLDADGGLPIDMTVTLYHVERATTSSPLALSPEELTAQHQSQFLQTLSQDLGKLRVEPGASAGAPEIVKLISKEGKEFPVNWWILAARSPVFRTMFQTPMSEVQEGIVRMNDIGSEVLEVFLEFVHTAKLSESWSKPGILEQLLSAAHKYLLQDLLDFLEKAVGHVCTRQNCGKLLRMARTLGLKEAENVLQAKCWNLLKQVRGSEERQLCEDLAFEG